MTITNIRIIDSNSDFLYDLIAKNGVIKDTGRNLIYNDNIVDYKDIMKKIFLLYYEKNIEITVHEEDYRYSITGICKTESPKTFKDLVLCKKIKDNIHFYYISTKKAINAIVDTTDKYAVNHNIPGVKRNTYTF